MLIPISFLFIALNGKTQLDGHGGSFLLEPSSFSLGICQSPRSGHFRNTKLACLFFTAVLVAGASLPRKRESPGAYVTTGVTQGLGFNGALEDLNL